MGGRRVHCILVSLMTRLAAFTATVALCGSGAATLLLLERVISLVRAFPVGRRYSSKGNKVPRSVQGLPWDLRLCDANSRNTNTAASEASKDVCCAGHKRLGPPEE